VELNMAINTKSFRNLKLNQKRFKYKITVGKSNAEGEFSLTVLVVPSQNENSLLRVLGLLTRNKWLDLGQKFSDEHYLVITKYHIQKMVELANLEGWNTEAITKPFVLNTDNLTIFNLMRNIEDEFFHARRH
jgi:hypothetical protein